jgi:hypothetical protein
VCGYEFFLIELITSKWSKTTVRIIANNYMQGGRVSWMID